jgi:hypothetical protein
LVLQQWDLPDRRWTALHLTEWLPELLFADLQPQVPSNLGTFFVGQLNPRLGFLSGRSTPISAETFQYLRVFRHVLIARTIVQSDEAMKPGIFLFVHHTHSPTASMVGGV